MHITAPYVFAIDKEIGMSVASPVANPATGEFGGVMLLDFLPMGLADAFDSIKQASYVITPEVDVYGGDIVVGPKKLRRGAPP